MRRGGRRRARWLFERQNEFYRDAKYVSKYIRTLKQQNQPGGHLSTASEHEVGKDKENGPKPRRKKQRENSLWSLREEYEEKHAEEKPKVEREAIIQAKREQRAKVEARKKALREKMFKKMKSGQPVMKYRIEQILEGLMESSKK